MLRVRRGKKALIAAAIGASLPATFSLAQTASWTYQGTAFPWTGTWNVATNWSPNSAFPNSATAVANFGPAQVAGATGNVVINNAPITLNKLTFTLSGTNAFGYLLSGSGTLASLTVANGGTLEVGGIGTDVISTATISTSVLSPANSTIYKQGNGNLVLSGVNNFGGGSGVNGLSVNAGTLIAMGANALKGLQVISTANSGVLELQGVTVGSGTQSVIAGVGSTGSFASGMVHAVGNNTWTGNWFTFAGSAGVDASSTLTVNGDLLDGDFPAANGFTQTGGTGLMQVNSAALNGPLLVQNGTFRFKTGGTPGSASRVGGLSISGGATPVGTVDLTNNSLIVDNADFASAQAMHSSIYAQVSHASNGLAWDSSGITSSTVANDINVNGIPTGIGIMLNNDGAGGNLFFGDGTDFPKFQGQSVDSNAVLLKYTYLGDSDLNGIVDTVDFSLFQAGFGNAVPYTSWAFGDYDYNGIVDTVDFSLFQAGYSFAGAPLGDPLAAQIVAFGAANDLPVLPGIAALVPEPGSLGIMCLGLIGLVRRRRKI